MSLKYEPASEQVVTCGDSVANAAFGCTPVDSPACKVKAARFRGKVLPDPDDYPNPRSHSLQSSAILSPFDSKPETLNLYPQQVGAAYTVLCPAGCASFSGIPAYRFRAKREKLEWLLWCTGPFRSEAALNPAPEAGAPVYGPAAGTVDGVAAGPESSR